MEYQASPNDSGYSPAQLCLSIQIRAGIPSVEKNYLYPSIPPIKEYRDFLKKRGENGKKNFDRRHRAKELERLDINDEVWVPDLQVYSKVAKV